MNMNTKIKKQLNSICYKYSGIKEPKEFSKLWSELLENGVEIPLIRHGQKSTSFLYNGVEVDNSLFVFQVYEYSNSLKNDYNVYFS